MARHADAWLSDRWYRRAWFCAPLAAVLLGGAVFLQRPSAPNKPPTPPGWVHPNFDAAGNAAMVTLRDQAKTDPQALALLRRQADDGNRNAQFYMGTLVDPTINRAQASPERTREAVAWYRKAADQHLGIAASNLGLLLAYDRPGQAADYAEAFSALNAAAATFPIAQRELGQLYRFGRGVPIDVSKGMDLIRNAADRNDPAAQTILAQAYDRGTDGLSQDPHEAAMLYQRAALAGNVFAEREIGIHLQRGLGVPMDREKASAWFRKAAEKGDAYAKTQVAGAAAPNDNHGPETTTPYRPPSFLAFPPIRP